MHMELTSTQKNTLTSIALHYTIFCINKSSIFYAKGKLFINFVNIGKKIFDK